MRAASDDFKQTWEAEAEREKEAGAPRTLPAAEQSAHAQTYKDPQPNDEELASVKAQSHEQVLASETAMPVSVASTGFESQTLEVRG
jgi:hypothetical protein